jgi:hypothetical protein
MTPFVRRTTFNFSEYLSRLPGSFVYERFLKRSGPERKIVSASTIQDIKTAFATDKNLKEAFSKLSKEAQCAVSLAYLFGEQGVPCLSLGRNLPKSGGKSEKNNAPPRETGIAFPGFDEECIGSFLVYAAQDSQGARFYVGFDEFEPKLRGLLCRAIVEMARTTSEKDTHPALPGLCVNDISAIVSLAAQGKLAKIKNGHFSKASEQYTGKLLHGCHAPFDWVAGQTRPAAFAFEYAYRRGLLSFRDDRYVPDHGRMCAWISRPLQELHADVVDFALSYLPVWRKTMIDEIGSLRDNPWLSSMAFGPDLSNRVSRDIKVLAYFGLVECQKIPGDLLFRASRPGGPGKTAAGKPRLSPRVMILPDFTALLPQEIAPDELYWFSRIGHLNSLDKVYKGTIAREVILDSLSAGIDGASMLDLLRRWQASANIMETVREWIREFSQVFMETGAIVVSAEEKVTKRLNSFGPLSAFLEPVRGHCVFRVAKGKEDLVAGLLTNMGFDHRPPMVLRQEKTGDHRTASELVIESSAGAVDLSPIVNFEITPEAPPLVLQQGKYSSQLKALEITELMHVIEYSLLMGNRLRIEYAGSPGIRKGIYQVRPLQYHKGPGSGLEAESGRMCVKKIFVLDRILKIGVEQLHE